MHGLSSGLAWVSLELVWVSLEEVVICLGHCFGRVVRGSLETLVWESCTRLVWDIVFVWESYQRFVGDVMLGKL